jgi:hypothetical protein
MVLDILDKNYNDLNFLDKVKYNIVNFIGTIIVSIPMFIIVTLVVFIVVVPIVTLKSFFIKLKRKYNV